ncbi:odorant receptor 13a-like [Trichogramma pretiosum]|uniref:odorant receptor 13a-like n=1 Tax=Trichogramma pretiosum TaxID=7493 RepID=UPI0006C9862D|nr:odorant receptor 13a-like [Trichogramma pretiosum]
MKFDESMINVESTGLKDYNWAVGLNRWSLRLMGIWPGEKQQYLRVPFMIGIIFFCLFLPQMYALALVMEHLPLVIDNLLTSCAALTSCFKLLFFWQNRQVLDLVIESMRKDWLRGCKDQRTRKTMLKAASRARLITTLDYSVMASCYAGFVVAPLLGFDLRTSNNITDYPPGGRKLLVQSYYPFDYSASPTFELAYFLQLVGSFFVGMAVSIPDDYFGALILHASAQFNVLAARIDGLIDEVTTTRDCRGPAAVADRSDSSTINRRLGRLVDRHVHLYSMVLAIEKSFSLVLAGQIFCMSVMVCCLGFQILSVLNNMSDKPTPLQMVTLIGTLFTMMLHTLIDCLASEALASQSTEIFYRICNSRWYELPYKSMRCLVPMMLVSKTPRQIKTGKIINMSLATYCSIIKSTAGYISVLIAVSVK